MSNSLQVLDQNGAASGDIALQDTWIEREKGAQAVHESVVAYLAAQRAGTACTKTRGEVRGSGKKPWRQKGTGRARVGTKQNPVWRGGGVAFGPKPRSYDKSINKKVKKLALRRAFTERVDAAEVIVVEDLVFGSPKTKDAIAFLNSVNAGDRALVIVSDKTPDSNLENTILSFSNLPKTILLPASSVNTYDMLSGKKVVITKTALQELGDRIS